VARSAGGLSGAIRGFANEEASALVCSWRDCAGPLSFLPDGTTMLPEQSGLLASLFSRSRRKSSKRGKNAQRTEPFHRPRGFEVLEERRLLVSHVYLDFGDFFSDMPTPPFAGLRVLNVRNNMTLENALVGTGAPTGVGAQASFERFGVMNQSGYTMVAFGDLVNNFNPTFVNNDAVTLELAVTAQIQRALAPYDIQVYSSATKFANGFTGGLTFQGGGATLALATATQGLNDLPGDGISPANGTAAVPQFGSSDVYIFLGGVFNTTTGAPLLIPISAESAISTANAQGGKPFRLDSGAEIDTNYWINRVLGAGGTGGSLNVAIANAAMYATGFDLGVSEVENGQLGPFTNFFDSNVQLLNQSNAMVEGGFNEDVFIPGFNNTPISDTQAMFFPRFPMMQDGTDFNPLLRPGTLGNPPVLFGYNNLTFPLPGQEPGFFLPPDSTINDIPTVTTNSYDELALDPDIGPNPDIAYVTGTGAFDQIFITKLNATQAKVTVKAYTDNTYTNLITTTEDGQPLIGTYTYTINLSKLVIPGRADDGNPFSILVEGCTSDDQIFLDPTLGVNVIVEGGPDVNTLFVTGNGTYSATYTPSAPASLATGLLPHGTGTISEVQSLIPEGLLPGAAGTLKITGATSSTVTTKTGTKTVTTTVSTPFTTTVSLEHFNPVNDSALRLENFNALTYASPGFLNNEFAVDDQADGTWQISGQVDSPNFPPALTGKLQFENIKHLAFDTTRGSSNDTITFTTGEILPPGLQGVTVAMGTGNDQLLFDDSQSIDFLNYVISPTLVQPSQPAGTNFAGFSYSGVDLLSVTGTDSENKFSVSPSLTTTYSLDALDPPSGTLPGDILSVNLSGTSGASPITPGDGVITFGSGQKPISYFNFETVATTNQILALAASSDNGTASPLVKVVDAVTQDTLYTFYAYSTTFKGGVRIAVADVTGDGVPDIITAPGAGRNDVRVFDGAVLAALPQDALHFISNVSTAVAAVIPDPASFNSGLYVTAGDVDGDGKMDIITSHSRGATLVHVYHNGGVFTLTKSWAPYVASITTGATVASGDTNGDGLWEVITAPGAGVAATVKVFNGQTGGLIRQFAGFESTFKGGVSLAAGDIDGDGMAEIVLGAGSGGQSRVRVFNGSTGVLRKQFQAYTTGTFNVPVRVAIVDPTGIGFGELWTAQGGVAAQRQVKEFDPLSGALVDSFFESTLDFTKGINLA
jgi:hypothetical protein